MYDESQDSVYRYSNVNMPGQEVPPTPEHEPKKKKEKSSFGFGKKLLLCVILGLFFGVCAGAGFYAVQIATGAISEGVAGKNDALAENNQGNGITTDNTTDDSSVYQVSSTISSTQTNVVTTVTDVSEVTKAVMPAIVSIVNEYTETADYGYWGTYSEDVQASGTGIIVGENDTELLIVTNYHVVADANKLTVTFADDSTAEALVKGTDQDMDLAVIAVDIADLDAKTIDAIAIATLGDSDNLQVGEPAIAIGNALGYGQSVTTGVISALNRQIGSDTSTDSTINGTFIQTDAAINPGNSGGALLNMQGEVIGINSNKIGGSTIEGMGYAIPISAAKPIIEDLMSKVTRAKVDEADRGYIGIAGVGSSGYTSELTGANMPDGVYVSKVYDNTAAAAAGIQVGDIITKFGDYTISDMSTLTNALAYYAAGDTVQVEIQRESAKGYRSIEITLTLGSNTNKY